MDEKTLLVFAWKIFSSASEEKAKIALKQLKRLLEEQGASMKNIYLINKMIDSVPEMKEASKQGFWTKEDIETAARRAVMRKAREQAAQYHGRC